VGNAKGLALKSEKSTNESFVSRELTEAEWQKVEKERILEETLGGVKAIAQLLLAKTIEHRDWDSYEKTKKDGTKVTVNAGEIDMCSGEAMAKIFNASCPSGFMWTNTKGEDILVKFSEGGYRNQGLKVVKLA